MLHKILTSCMLKSTQGMIVTFLVVMNKSIPPRIFFQLLPRFPLTCAKNPVYYYCCAGVAQLVEQLIRNQQVAGSSPATSSINRAGFRLVILRGLFLCFLYKNSSALLCFSQQGACFVDYSFVFSVSGASSAEVFFAWGWFSSFTTGIKRLANLFLPRLRT
jgi:hypothetical protein